MKSFTKRFLAMLLAVLMTVSLFTVGSLADTAAPPTWGDINADDGINAADALLALQHSVKLITLTEEEFAVADVDGNDLVDATDALYILQYSVKLIDKFPVEDQQPDPGTDPGFDPNPGPEMEIDLENMIRVTDSPYNAKGDGVTNDRAAIQAAIDDASKAGGGTVALTAGKTFYTGNIIMKSNVILYFEDGTMLKQSSDPDDYVKPVGDSYEPYRPVYGCNSTTVLWGHAWLENYPFIYAGEGTENITITSAGNGIIEMTRGTNGCSNTIHIEPISFYRTKNFEVSNLTIQNFSAYLYHNFHCNNGLIKNITGRNPNCGSNDGIGLINSQNIRVTGCDLITSDDGCYVLQTYGDPRGNVWYDPNAVQPCKDIEIDNNRFELTWDECKSFSFFTWGSAYPDQSLVEISNIYVHDNQFETLGIWNDFPFDDTSEPSPIKNIRFENNEIREVQGNFYATPISDIYGFDCMDTMRNGNFEKTADSYWVSRQGGSAGAKKDSVGQDGTWYGYIDNLKKADAALYQGLKLFEDRIYTFSAKVQSSGDTVRLFVRDQVTQELIASQEFNNTEWAEASLEFQVPATGNYHVGIERGNATDGWARIDSADLQFEYSNVEVDNTIFTTQTPDGSTEGTAELGTLFSAVCDGQVTKARIYTGESGTHTVRLWDYETQTVVAGPYEWTVETTEEGWQEFTLPEPALVQADKKYVIAVSTDGEGGYLKADGQLSNPISRLYLVTYADGGLYTDQMGSMPTAASGTNYFRDIVFEPDQKTIFTIQAPNSAADNFGGCRLFLGTRFSTKVDGTVTKVRLYTSALEEGIHYVVLWDYETATMVSAEMFEWNITAGTEGWKEFTLPEAVALTAGKQYVVGVSAGPNFYGVRQTPSGVFPIENDYIVTYEDSGMWADIAVNGKKMPNNSASECYFRDIVFVPAQIQANKVIATIDALPELAELSDKEVVEAARAAYQDLPDAHKDLVTNLDKLVAAEERISQLEEEARITAENKAKADAVITAIVALPDTVTLSDKEAVEAARTAYNALTDTQKTLVGDISKLTKAEARIEALLEEARADAENKTKADAVITKIKAIPDTVTLNDKATVTEARTAYNALTDTQKALVTNTAKLTAAEARIAQLEEEARIAAENKAKADAVTATIDALPTIDTVTESDAEAVAAARSAYDALTDEQKALVSTDTLARLQALETKLSELVPDPVTIYTDQVPAMSHNGGGMRNQYGTLFTTKVSGTVTKVRVYTCAEESGIHYVSIWDYATNQMITEEMYEWDITAGTEGWHEFTLPEAVHLDADKSYIVSVSAGPDCLYTITTDAAQDIENDYLVVRAATAGSYTANAITGFYDMPTVVTNFYLFRDVVFYPDKASTTPEESKGISILTTQTPNSTADNFGGCRLFLGTRFSTKVDGTVTKVRLYTSALEEGIHYVALWDYETATMVSAEMYEWNITAGTEGWKEFTLPEAVALTAGKQYVVAVSAGPNAYGVRQTPSGVFPIENEYIITYDDSGMWADMSVNGQNMPSGLGGECYFRDIVFVPAS